MSGLTPLSRPELPRSCRATRAPRSRVQASPAGEKSLELAGAIGLLLLETATLTAVGLIALLVAMFPANVHAARQQLVWRLPLQLFWMGALDEHRGDSVVTAVVARITPL